MAQQPNEQPNRKNGRQAGLVHKVISAAVRLFSSVAVGHPLGLPPTDVGSHATCGCQASDRAGIKARIVAVMQRFRTRR